MEFIPNFAVFEGGDGSGTTTQISKLTERFKNIKKPIFFPTFEPTDEKTGRLIRAILKKETTLEPETLCFLFAADRNEHLYGQDGILAHTKRNELVVSDRYALSSLVYQGIECGDELPQALNSRFPAPELTIFFDLNPEIAIKRIKDRSSHEIYEYLDFQAKVREKYIYLLKTYSEAGGKVEIIDASGHVQEVADQVWSIISQMPIFKHSENTL
ncbi:MAG: dTMP kinase [Spirochaetes bacterium]|nr:dTMP kinase [Brevinematales bacterium]MCL1960143.1 dTMP kinase [Spirochaetota bacterium]